MHRSEALFGQILRIDILRPFSVRFYAYIFGGPFQSDSTHRSEARFGQILRINIWRPFSVRFNAQIRGHVWSDSTHKRGPFQSDSTHRSEALFGLCVLVYVFWSFLMNFLFFMFFLLFFSFSFFLGGGGGKFDSVNYRFTDGPIHAWRKSQQNFEWMISLPLLDNQGYPYI